MLGFLLQAYIDSSRTESLFGPLIREDSLVKALFLWTSVVIVSVNKSNTKNQFNSPFAQSDKKKMKRLCDVAFLKYVLVQLLLWA